MASSYYFNCVKKEAIMLMNIRVLIKLQIQLFMSHPNTQVGKTTWHALCISLQRIQVGGRRLFLLFDKMVEKEFNKESHFASMHRSLYNFIPLAMKLYIDEIIAN